ncbi:MAG: 2-oxoglutarate dehydrogenase, E2 component, dihydrolipoamide succinyltransferase, partial [Mycobacterium sp.]
LTKIIAREDDTVEVGGELAIIGDAAQDAGGPPAAEAAPEPEPEPQAEPEPQPQPAAASSDGEQGATTPVLMPELGESVTEGTVTRWLKKVGDHVQADEPLVEVSTDKVDTEIPSPVAGTLVSITAEEDVTVAVGGELAKIGAGAAETTPAPPTQPAPQPQAPPQPEPEPEPQAKPAPPQPAPGTGAPSTPYVTPLVRKLATENSIDLAELSGTGVGGRIRKQDVLAAVEKNEAAKKAPPTPAAQPAAAAAGAKPAAPTPAPALAHLRGTTAKASRIRQLTANKTRESLQATAQLTQTHEVDMTRIVALRGRAKTAFAEREGVNLTYLPFIARAVIDALKAHPNVNASYTEDTKEITYYDAEHIGFAVDT